MSELERGRIEFSDPTKAPFGHQRVQPIIPPPRAPVLCPVCQGKLTVSAGFYMDGGSSTAREKCRTCNGRGIV